MSGIGAPSLGGLVTTSTAAFSSTLPVVMATKREYKTLPRSFQEVRKSSDKKKESNSQASSHPTRVVSDANKIRHQDGHSNADGDHSAMYNFNVGLSNFISGGIHFFGNLGRRKSNNTSRSSSPPPRSSSALDSLTSSSESSCMTTSASEAFHSAFSSISNIKKKEIRNTTNGRESIEMSTLSHINSLPHAEGGDWEEGSSGRYLEEQVGRGHDFAPVGTFNPTWCDLCRELVWGLYDTGATRCIRCHLTCHVRCQFKIKLNCVASELLDAQHDLDGDNGSQSDSSTLSSSSSTSSADEIDHDESTLANISTLKEEYHERADVDSGDIIPPPDEFSDKENDEGDEDDYNRTLKDVSLMEDFTLDDDTPTTLPKDPFPPISGQSTLNEASINSYKPDSSLFVATLQSVLGDDEKLVKALEVYNHNTPDGQKTILIRDDEETNENPIVERHSDINSSQKHSEDTFDGSYQVLMNLTKTLVTKRECRGYIRVVLNLRRPINVQSGTRPPSTYTIVSSTRDISGTLTLTQEQADNKSAGLTSFYLPVDTVKALHVTTLTSVHDVIRTLLAKFRVVDNPHKFALYEKISTMRGIMSRRQSRKNSFTSQGSGTRSSHRRASRTTLVRHNLRKMSNEERPLVLALARCLKEQGTLCEDSDENIDKTRCYFVLQENDPGEMIAWESFTMPELKNFIRILDREEAWYKKRIHEKYEMVLHRMQMLMDEKRPKGEITLDDMNNPSMQSDC